MSREKESLDYFTYDALLRIASRCRDSNNISDIEIDSSLNVTEESNICVDWDIGFMIENEKVARSCADKALSELNLSDLEKRNISRLADEASVFRELAEMENLVRTRVREELEI